MRPRLKLYWILLFLLTALIVVRRLVWQQVPTQIADHWVWLTVVGNAAILALLIKQQVRRQYHRRIK